MSGQKGAAHGDRCASTGRSKRIEQVDPSIARWINYCETPWSTSRNQHPGGSEIWFDAADGVISEVTISGNTIQATNLEFVQDQAGHVVDLLQVNGVVTFP